MENIKAKIQGILIKNSQKSVIGWTVEEDDFEAVAEEIVKKCSIPHIGNIEAKLRAFAEEYVEAFEDGRGSDTALYRQAKSLLN